MTPRHHALKRSPLSQLLHMTLFSTMAGATGLAFADDIPDAFTGPVAVVEIKGKADANAYRARQTAAGTKTGTDILDLPQSVTVVTKELIKDQAMQSMADVVRFVPGIGMANGEGNRDSPVFRGSASASGDFYIDGVRDDVEYYRDLYNVERVEALTGPNAMIFGRGGSGGVINRVSRHADFSTVRAADLTLGSYRNRRLTVDVGQAVSDAVALRVTGLKEDSGGYQRNATLERSGINPTMAIRFGRDTSAVFGYEHFSDERAADRGVPSYRGRPYQTAVSAFFGDPDPAARPVRLYSDAFSSVIDHAFGHGIHLRNTTRYTRYDKFYQNFNSGAINLESSLVPISAYNNHQWRKNLFNQTDVTMDIDSGAIRHTVLAGLELGKQDTDYLRTTGVFANGATSFSVPLASPDGPLPVNFVLGGSSNDRDGTSNAKVAGLYAQDQIALGEHWQVIAGVRFDRFKVNYTNRRPEGVGAVKPSAARLSSADNLVSPRVGVMYKPAPEATLYANYSVASFPRAGDQLSSLSTVNQGLAPEKFVNYEAGAKWEVTKDLLATVAVYRLNRNNVAVTDPQTGIADKLVKGQRTNGVEIGFSGKLARDWSIQGGYAHQDAKLLATASATALAGSTVGMVPKNTFSLWNRVNVSPQFGAGLGLLYRDDMYASTSNAVVLPGYVRVDGALYYTINRSLSLQLNVENLLDKRYYASANGDNNITVGSPRAVKLGVHVRL